MTRLRSNARLSFEMTAVFIFVVVLVSNLIVIQFAKGYFNYYDISLGIINFSPQMYDYVRIAAPALIASGFIVMLAYGLSLLDDAITRTVAAKVFTRSTRSLNFISEHRKLLDMITYILSVIFKVITIGLAFYILYVLAVTVIPKIGETTARESKQFTSISKSGEVRQEIIIYKNSDGILLKTYNTDKKKFEEGYRFMTNANYEGRAFYR